MPRLFISRLLETFFRRKWLYLLALVPFIALGVVTVLNSSESFRAIGTIQVNKASGISTEGEGDPFGGQTPAAFTSAQIAVVLGNDDFVASVIKEAEKNGSAPLTPEEVRRSVSAAGAGFDLVTINATAADPALSVALANATTTAFRQREIDKKAAALEAARKYNLGPAAIAVEPAATTEAAEAEAEARAETFVDARYVIPSEGATPPIGAEPHRKKDVLTVVLFLMLGMMVAAAALVVATLMDRSVRYGEEIETQLHVPVLASVPNSRAAIKPLVV